MQREKHVGQELFRQQRVSASTPQPFTPESLLRSPHSAAHALSLCSQPEARACLSYELALKLCALPLGLSGPAHNKVLSIAVAQEKQFEVRQQLKFCISKELKLIPLERVVVERAVFLAYKGEPKTLQDSTVALQQYDTARAPVVSDSGVPPTNARSEPTIFLNHLIEYALAHDATDLHIAPRQNGTYVSLRINGELQTHPKSICALATHAELIQRLKVLAKLNTTIKFLPQDGAFSLADQKLPVRIRVNLMPTLHGEKAALRFLGTRTVTGLDELGLPMLVLSWLEKVMQREEGAVLFTGPTGSGKSTTMYAMLAELIKAGRHALTIEDPVEIVVSEATQVSLLPQQGLDYAAALRASMRQDPDVLLLGEIRDHESAAAALQLALTGHLLLSTVHGRTVFDVLVRLVSLGIDRNTVAQALTVLLNLRLVPLLCSACKVVDLEASNRSSTQVFKPVGCARCEYSGIGDRTLVVEALAIDEAIRAAITAGHCSAHELAKQLTYDNYISADAKVLDLYRAGMIAERDYRAHTTSHG